MYVRTIEIENIKGFVGRQTLSLERLDGSFAGWNVFAGRNGSGKSTLLKAVALAICGPSRARVVAGGFPHWVRQGTAAANVYLELTHDPTFDKFVGSSGKTPKGALWAGLRWTANPKVGDSVERSDERSPKKNTKSVDRGPWADQPVGWFAAAYGPYRRLGQPTPDMEKFDQYPDLARFVNLFIESATISNSIDWLKQVHLRELEKREGAAEQREAVLNLLNDGLLPDGGHVQKVDSDGLWIRRDGVDLPLRQMSDGYRTVAALVTDIIRRLYDAYGTLAIRPTEDGAICCDLPGVVLIDEVDSHLHVAWQQRLGTWLVAHFPNIQFLVTTHSPFICQAASPAGLFRLPRPGDESDSMRVVDDNVWRAVTMGGVDDAVLSELFGLEHSHSGAAETLIRHVASLEASLLRGDKSDRTRNEYVQLKAQLPGDIATAFDIRRRAINQGQAE